MTVYNENNKLEKSTVWKEKRIFRTLPDGPRERERHTSRYALKDVHVLDNLRQQPTNSPSIKLPPLASGRHCHRISFVLKSIAIGFEQG